MSDVLYLTVADRVAGSRTDGGTMVGRRDRCWTASIPTGADEPSIGGAGGGRRNGAGAMGRSRGNSGTETGTFSGFRSCSIV